jgi:hypothetical protein
MRKTMLIGLTLALVAGACEYTEDSNNTTPTEPTPPSSVTLAPSCSPQVTDVFCRDLSFPTDDIVGRLWQLTRGGIVQDSREGQSVTFPTSTYPEPCGQWVVEFSLTLLDGSKRAQTLPVTIDPALCEEPVP